MLNEKLAALYGLQQENRYLLEKIAEQESSLPTLLGLGGAAAGGYGAHRYMKSRQYSPLQRLMKSQAAPAITDSAASVGTKAVKKSLGKKVLKALGAGGLLAGGLAGGVYGADKLMDKYVKDSGKILKDPTGKELFSEVSALLGDSPVTKDTLNLWASTKGADPRVEGTDKLIRRILTDNGVLDESSYNTLKRDYGNMRVDPRHKQGLMASLREKQKAKVRAAQDDYYAYSEPFQKKFEGSYLKKLRDTYYGDPQLDAKGIRGKAVDTLSSARSRLARVLSKIRK